MFTRIRKRYQEIRGQICFDWGDCNQTIFLAGSGRSGTTWIQEIINYDNSFRIMFEPFHSLKIDILKEWNYLQYLRYDNKDKKYIEPATKIFEGKIRHPWVDRYNRRFFTNKRLIKDIRANLFLKWIKYNFPEIPIVFILRHPCAVVSSKMKLKWDTHLDLFLEQEDCVTDYLNPFKKELEEVSDNFEKHIYMWCVENYIPLKQFNMDDILVVFYEDLCDNRENEIENILSFLGNKVSSKVFEMSKKPSSQSRLTSTINTGESLVSSWRKYITNEQIGRAVEILKIFGLDAIYGEGDYPLVSGKEALSVFSD